METESGVKFEAVYVRENGESGNLGSGLGQEVVQHIKTEVDPDNYLDLKMEPPSDNDDEEDHGEVYDNQGEEVMKCEISFEDHGMDQEGGAGNNGTGGEAENWGFICDDKSPIKFPSPGKVSHKCEECGKAFSHRGDLRKHLVTHTGERPYACSVCSKRFTQSSNLHTHLRTHTGVETRHTCPQCGQTFTQNVSMLRHLLLHSCDTAHQCPQCPKVFSHGHKLRRHLRSHADILHRCEECGKRYTERESLVAHLRLHSGECSFQCEQCSKYFTHRGDYRKHLRIHTGERPHHCPQCPKSFSQRSNLRTHLRIHTGEKPHSCNHCERSFSQLANLRKHLKTHMRDALTVINLSPLVVLEEDDSNPVVLKEENSELGEHESQDCNAL